MAIERPAELGHRRIAHVSGGAADRLRGYERAMARGSGPPPGVHLSK